MLIYVLRRVLLAFSVIIAAICVTFSVFFLGPSDPVQTFCPSEKAQCPAERRQQIRESLGLDKPATEQLASYLKGMAVGRDISSGGGGRTLHCDWPCMGTSWVQTNVPVLSLIKNAFPVTLSVVLGGYLVSVPVALAMGVLAARFRGRTVDRLIVGISQFATSIPYYIMALVFFLVTMIYNHWLPRTSYTSPTENMWKWITGLLAVWIFYGLIGSCGYIRYIRSSMIDVQTSDYVRTARSKGISERSILFKHALRAAIAPFVTLVGLNIAAELTGAVFTEQIFDLPGMGKLMITAVHDSDLPVMSGLVVVASALVCIGNLLVDILYGVVDPRVKLS